MTTTGNNYRRRLDSIKAKLDVCRGSVAEKKDIINKYNEEMIKNRKKYTLYNITAEKMTDCSDIARRRIINIVKNIVDGCLKILWPDTSLDIEFITNKRYSGCKFGMCKELSNGEFKIIDPLRSEGGSVWDIVSFSMRVAFLLLARPTRRRLLLLDEAFSQLHEDNIEKGAKYIRTVAERFNLQIILVTHNTKFIKAAHHVINMDEV